MSDTKKPTVSEIRAWLSLAQLGKHSLERARLTHEGAPYLLDLVARMGKAFSKFRCPKSYCNCVAGEPYGIEDCIHCNPARALLEELKK